MFRIKDLEFGVASAELFGFIARSEDGRSELGWHFNVGGVPKEIEELEWRPRAYGEGLQIDVRSWQALEGAAIVVPDEPESIGWGAGYLYAFEHLPMRKNALRLLGLHGVTFQMEWDAECDLFFNDDYDEALPLSIRTPLTFLGVEVREDVDVARATEMLAEHLDVKGFADGKVENGRVIFRPNAG